MKQAKRLTRDQKEVIQAHGYKPDEWALVEETEFYYKIINKQSGIIRSVDKFYKGGRRK